MSFQGPDLLLTKIKSDRVKVAKHLELDSEIVSVSGAISVVKPVSYILAAAVTCTLANGTYPGQIKIIICKTYSSTITVTPANHINTSIAFGAAGQSWIGIWHDANWYNIAINAATVT
jgi:hypothetical protein